MRVTSYPAEWVALLAGVKPGLRLLRAPGNAAAELRAARARGLAAEVIERVDGAGRSLVYVARTPAAARALRDLEAPIRPGRGVQPLTAADLAAHRALGAALGYPPCCIDAFAERVARGVDRLPSGETAHEDFVAASTALARSRAPDPRCNIFAAGDNSCWLSHVPCALDCAASIAYADRVRAAYVVHGARAAAQIDRALATAVAIGRDGRRGALADADADACRLVFEGP